MILLMGFKDYDDFDLEFQVTGTEVLRLAELLGAPGTRTNAVAIVTLYPRGLDNADQTRYPIGYTDGGDAHTEEFDLFQQDGR